jgi:hypothetical protein
MSQQATFRPREVTVAATVALIGGGLFIVAGLLLAGTVAIMLKAISQKYPGVSFRNAGQDFKDVMQIIAYGIAIPIVLGIIGIVTGLGLLHLKLWARKSVIAWSIGSSLLCLAALASPQFKSGVRLNPAGILTFMLFLFPINAWWLLLFFRPTTKILFSPSATATRIKRQPKWLTENFMAKSVIILALVLLLALGSTWQLRRSSPMREIERSRDALATINSWHIHTVRHIPDQPVETVDVDTSCPSFQRRISSFDDANDVTQVRDSIHYFNTYDNHIGDRWIPAPMRFGQTDPGIVECSSGPMSGDQNSLPYPGVIEDGTVKRGELNDVNGESCREYDISVPTPHDPQEKEFRSSICINEQDHLPRQTRRTPPDYNQEEVTIFGKWNAINEPQLPPEISQ